VKYLKITIFFAFFLCYSGTLSGRGFAQIPFGKFWLNFVNNKRLKGLIMALLDFLFFKIKKY